jgi:hypothetical protein
MSGNRQNSPNLPVYTSFITQKFFSLHFCSLNMIWILAIININNLIINMKDKINIINILRQISSVLLLFSVIVQIAIVLFLASDFDEFEIDEIHEISGYVLLGLILIHTALYWKCLKSLFIFKGKTGE